MSEGSWAELARPGARRSLGFLAVGAMAGLLVAGFGLFTAKGAATRILPAEDLALVNQRPILRSDFVTQTEAAYGRPFGRTTPAERRRVVEDMLREELFVQRGLELDLAASDPDVRQALVSGVERQVAADVTAQQPTDAELRAFFAVHKADYASVGVMAVHDLIPAGGRSRDADLAAAAAELHGGVSRRQVLERHGLVDARAAVGEEFYYAARAHLPPVLFAAATPLKVGQAAGPIIVDATPHILVMEKNVPPVPQSFEEARDRLVQDYTKASQQKIEAADAAYLRRKADILLAPEYR